MIQMHFSSLSKMAIIALAAVGNVVASGVHCNGSPNCIMCKADSIFKINEQIHELAMAARFENNQRIACAGQCCAFLQNIKGPYKRGVDVKQYSRELLAHGCIKCGAWPTEGDNNGTNGQLTVNFLSLETLSRAKGDKLFCE